MLRAVDAGCYRMLQALEVGCTAVVRCQILGNGRIVVEMRQSRRQVEGRRNRHQRAAV